MTVSTTTQGNRKLFGVTAQGLGLPVEIMYEIVPPAEKRELDNPSDPNPVSYGRAEKEAELKADLGGDGLDYLELNAALDRFRRAHPDVHFLATFPPPVTLIDAHHEPKLTADGSLQHRKALVCEVTLFVPQGSIDGYVDTFMTLLMNEAGVLQGFAKFANSKGVYGVVPFEPDGTTEEPPTEA